MDTDPERDDSALSGGLDQPHIVEVLRALLDFRSAEEAMSRRSEDSMQMGATDLQAIRFLLHAQGAGRSVSGRELADHLGITSASVTGLLDRLTATGHVKRTPHPTNRRSNLVTATVDSDDEVREVLGPMHGRLLDAARDLSDADAELISQFLDSLTAVVDGIDRGTPSV